MSEHRVEVHKIGKRFHSVDASAVRSSQEDAFEYIMKQSQGGNRWNAIHPVLAKEVPVQEEAGEVAGILRQKNKFRIVQGKESGGG